MKKTFLILASVAIIVALLALVLAVKPNETGELNVTGPKAEKNMTYGQCVSENAVLKNSCYSSVKEIYSLCKSNATETVKCNTEYKTSMSQCKKTFKDSKNECKKIKHNFFETLRYSMA